MAADNLAQQFLGGPKPSISETPKSDGGQVCIRCPQPAIDGLYCADCREADLDRRFQQGLE